jgi:hypothetical protein
MHRLNGGDPCCEQFREEKIGSIFDSLEEEIKKYPREVKDKALIEAQWMVSRFSQQIQRAAIEKDRILRGNGIEFPPEHDAGHWLGCGTGDIQARVEGLRRIYCDLEQEIGAATAKLSDAVILKPAFMGMGMDLQKAWAGRTLNGAVCVTVIFQKADYAPL